MQAQVDRRIPVTPVSLANQVRVARRPWGPMAAISRARAARLDTTSARPFALARAAQQAQAVTPTATRARAATLAKAARTAIRTAAGSRVAARTMASCIARIAAQAARVAPLDRARPIRPCPASPATHRRTVLAAATRPTRIATAGRWVTRSRGSARSELATNNTIATTPTSRVITVRLIHSAR